MNREQMAEKYKTPRRSRKQIDADEKAVQWIAEIVRKADRWNQTALRETVDKIGDILVAAGRL